MTYKPAKLRRNFFRCVVRGGRVTNSENVFFYGEVILPGFIILTNMPKTTFQ